MQPGLSEYTINLNRARSSTTEILKTYRILFLISLVIIVISGLIYRRLDNVNDPVFLRISAAVICVVALLLSFTSNYIKTNIVYFSYCIAISLVLWVIYIVALNHFNVNFSIALMMVFLAVGVIFTKASHLVFYYLFANCCIEIACITTENIEVNGLLYMVYTAGSSLIFYTVLSKNIKNNEQLLLNKEYLTSIFNSAPEGLFIINEEDGEIYDCNKKACKIFDADKRHELTGRKFNDFVKMSGADWKLLLESYAARHSNNQQIEFTTLTKRKIWGQFEISRITFDTRHIYILQVNDISEQKSIKDNQVIQLKNLENVNTELHEILQTTSNDIKAPLRTLSNLTNWLSTDYKEQIGKHGEEQLQLVNKRIKKLYSVVDGITLYSKTTRMNKLLEKTDINQTIHTVISTLNIPENITVEIMNELPTVFYDTERLSFVFLQLIDNAIKSIIKPNGKVEISSSQDDNFYQVSITDNGIGIEKMYFDKIFQVFQKLSFDDEQDNIGLGLTLTKKIIETYGGKIWLESEVGIGSTFYFTIPK